VDGSFRVVLLCGGQAEYCHDRVADEFFDQAVLRLDARRPAVEIRVEDFAHVFRVQAGRHGGKADKIQEMEIWKYWRDMHANISRFPLK
jgi:hypothetical protein